MAGQVDALPQQTLSLDQAYRSVAIPLYPGAFRRLFAYAGPAIFVSVGYMDPGNWATDLEGGASFGYQLLWVLLLSNLMAVLLQTLAARLGIVSGRDLAQACREHYPLHVSRILWVLSELAIIACDLAEVLGTAIALNLLFKIPLLWGILITAFDALLLIAMIRFGIRKLEAVIFVLVLTIGACFALEVFLVQPDWGRVAAGFVPNVHAASLYVAIGILGATVMPHNLYLHSALVQTRRIGASEEARREAIRFNFIDTVTSLNVAFFINAAILIVAAGAFFTHGIAVKQIDQAQALLAPLLGTGLASLAFGVALLCAGQNSTVTGTLAGQIVMEGFLRIRLSPVLRRVLTRGLAVIPALLVILWAGEKSVLQLLVLSQVVLSLQLPFAIIPLIRFTSDGRLMGKFVSPGWLKILAWLSTALIVVLNAWLVQQSLGPWLQEGGPLHAALQLLTYLLGGMVLGFLLWIGVSPLGNGERKRVMLGRNPS